MSKNITHSINAKYVYFRNQKLPFFKKNKEKNHINEKSFVNFHNYFNLII